MRDLCVGPVGSAVKVVYPGWGYWWSVVPAAVAAPLLNTAAASSSVMVEVWEGDQRFGMARLPSSQALVWGTVQHPRPQPPPKDSKTLARHFSDAFQHLARPAGKGTAVRRRKARRACTRHSLTLCRVYKTFWTLCRMYNTFFDTTEGM